MKALLISLGAIGRRHLTNLRGLERAADITVLRRPESAREGIPEAADRVVYSLEDALRMRPDVALIASPAPQHIEMALKLASEGIHLFIEKPLSSDLSGVDALISESRRQGLTLTVGYNLRFCRSLQMLRTALIEGRIGRLLAVRSEVGQYLPDWRPGADYRKSASANAILGGGVVLELSHEIDYVRWLAGDFRSVSARLACIGGLELDVEDSAELIFDLHAGGLAHIHLDMIQRVPTRTCRLIGSEGILEWDGLGHWVKIRRPGDRDWQNVWSAEKPYDTNGSYVDEMRHFLDCVRNRRSPAVTGEDGRRVVEIVLAVKRSSAEGRVVEL